VRNVDDAHRLAEHIALSPNLRLRGIEAFEGIVREDGGEVPVRALVKDIAGLAEACRAEGLFAGKPILTAGGSAYFDIVADVLGASEARSRFAVVLRSGCYITHDSDYYERMMAHVLDRTDRSDPGLRPAIEIWAYVLSRPERDRIIAGLGKRDASFDIDLPKPVGWARPGSREVRPMDGTYRTVRLNDHHAYIDVPPECPLQVGDLICFGISHPCTTFDRWPALYVVDDSRTVVGAIRTYF